MKKIKLRIVYLILGSAFLLFALFVLAVNVIIPSHFVNEAKKALLNEAEYQNRTIPYLYDEPDYDEAAFIRSLSFLTNAEKDALIADYNRLVEIDNQMCKLYDTIWGDTGCESGICPF